MKKILWDFNGTILDDVEVSLDCLNTLRRIYYNLKPLTLKEYREVFTFPIIGYYQKAGFDFTNLSFEKVGKQWVELYKNNSHRIVVKKNIYDFIEKHQKDYEHVILTASHIEMVKQQLKEYKIDHFFKMVLGIDNIYASSKLAIAKAYMQDKNPEDFMMFGDTLHDFDVASEIGVKICLLADGHQSKQRLLAYCDVVYDNIEEFSLLS